LTREVSVAVTPCPVPIAHDLSSAKTWLAESEMPKLDSLLCPQV
jgi:hypothetical protein